MWYDHTSMAAKHYNIKVIAISYIYIFSKLYSTKNFYFNIRYLLKYNDCEYYIINDFIYSLASITIQFHIILIFNLFNSNS